MCVETHPNSAKPSGKQCASQVPANDSPKCNSASQRLHLSPECVNAKLLGGRLTCDSKARPTSRGVNEAILTQLKPRNPHPDPCAHPQRCTWAVRDRSQHLELKLPTIPFSRTVHDSKMSTELKQHTAGDILNKTLIYSLILAPITRHYSSPDYRCASLLWEKH